ncbi:MAG: phosphoribosyltransferase [Candidatus Cloacimonetes bacterium]|nr:phosphoribosyltransferase [Candidatus Cloacimonadota bacterium]
MSCVNITDNYLKLQIHGVWYQFINQIVDRQEKYYLLSVEDPSSVLKIERLKISWSRSDIARTISCNLTKSIKLLQIIYTTSFLHESTTSNQVFTTSQVTKKKKKKTVKINKPKIYYASAYPPKERHFTSLNGYCGDYFPMSTKYKNLSQENLDFRKNLLLLKNSNANGYIFFENLINKQLETKLKFLLDSNLETIIPIPGHTCSIINDNNFSKLKLTSGLINFIRRFLGRRLSVSNGEGCIYRSKTVVELRKSREIQTFDSSRGRSLKSIKVNPDRTNLILDKTILLIDDIFTTGGSMNACKKILKDAGAKEVICFALGRTV